MRNLIKSLSPGLLAMIILLICYLMLVKFVWKRIVK